MILIVYKDPRADSPYASHAGLGVVSAYTADTLTASGIDAQAVPVIDGYDLQRKLSIHFWGHVTRVLLSAPFFDTPFLTRLCHQFPKIQFSIVYHSNVGFLAVDNWSTRVLLEQLALRLPNFRVAVNSRRLQTAILAAYNHVVLYLPNLYPTSANPTFNHWSGGPIHIGAFGAIRVLKNLPTSAWASIIISNLLNTQVHLSVSAGREEGQGAPNLLTNIRSLIAAAPRVTLHELPWEGWDSFRTTVSHQHLLLQPSYTESFNGVTADGASQGIPSVVSPAIDWAPPLWTANPDDAYEVATVGAKLLTHHHLARLGYESLKDYTNKGIEQYQYNLNK